MEWIISPLAFSYAFHQVEPGKIVDKIIQLAVDVMTPGRGTGASSWWMRGLRQIEQQAERAQHELDLRSNLRQWDDEYPFLHHELILRYAAGILASNIVSSIYHTMRRSTSPSRK